MSATIIYPTQIEWNKQFLAHGRNSNNISNETNAKAY